MGEPPDPLPTPEEHALRHAWFDLYNARFNARPRNLPLRCPCCFCRTLRNRADFEICEVCFWEDDGQDDGDLDESRGGPNGSLSLREARANYRRFGACNEDMLANVRPPRVEEIPGHGRPGPGVSDDLTQDPPQGPPPSPSIGGAG